MSGKVSFVYREFYDVPRLLILRYGNLQLLLESTFDSANDDYSTTYRVFALPDISENDLLGSWDRFSEKARRFLGEIPVRDLQFDPTTRQEVDTDALDRLMAGLPAE